MDGPLDREVQLVAVPETAVGARLDRFLADALGIPRKRVMEAFEAGEVRVAGKRVKKSHPCAAGEQVTIGLRPARTTPEPQPELPLVVVHEDPAFLVLDKPTGWPTHPLEPGEKGTLANAVMARFPECGGAGADPREAGATQRLDAETSGLIVVARTPAAWAALRGQFTARTVLKEYVALAAGSVFGPVEVAVPIGREPGSTGRWRGVTDERRLERLDAREAHTLVEVERAYVGWSLVRCTISTGVTHQIRVHLAHLGSPVAGDDAYGGARPAGLHRMFLHSARLAFDHPVTGERVDFEAPLPADLQRVLEGLSG